MDSVSVSATVTLSSDWIVHVWSRGMGVVEGALVLDVVGPGATQGATQVRAVRWRPNERQPGVAQPVIVTVDVVQTDAGWRLAGPNPEPDPEPKS